MDRIEVDGRLLSRRSAQNDFTRVILYHKPEGEICTSKDPEGRPTIFRNLPRLKTGRWVSVGRLDINTSGLLLLTTDGELANRLMHPKYQIEREYAVRILGEVSDETLQQLRSGVMLEDGPAHFDHIIDAGGKGANHWYHVILREGRNREVRRLWEAVGHTVSRLQRVRFANITLDRSVKTKKWRDLTPAQIRQLLKMVDLKREAVYDVYKSSFGKGKKKTSRKKIARKSHARRQ
jgi:23S rRNA pseudouridine2605 synthase